MAQRENINWESNYSPWFISFTCSLFITHLSYNEEMKKLLLIRMWKFMFPLIDLRLIGLMGFAFGLMIAKLWKPILYLDWYWYLIIALLASIKPLTTFFKQVWWNASSDWNPNTPSHWSPTATTTVLDSWSNSVPTGSSGFSIWYTNFKLFWSIKVKTCSFNLDQ